jgi:hypothetical protein
VSAHAARAFFALRVFSGRRLKCRGGSHIEWVGKRNLSDWFGGRVGKRLYFVVRDFIG